MRIRAADLNAKINFTQIGSAGRRKTLRVLYYKNLGVYTVRFPFVIYGFSLAETESASVAVLHGRALEDKGSESFCTVTSNLIADF
jgi:hypothetical protein